MTHNQVWAIVIAMGWIALAVFATRGFTEIPHWSPPWSPTLAELMR